MEIRFSKQAVKDIKAMPKDIARHIKDAIDGLSNIPPQGDIKPLQGYKDGRMRLRVGKYRVIFKYIDDNTVYVWIIEIGSRGDIYK